MATLYLWGKPIAKELQPTRRQICRPLPLHTPIRSVSCGENHCMVVAEDGVYGVGDNTEGQLGMRGVRNSGLVLSKIQFGFKASIIEVSCGWHHTLLLDSSGNVFSSGRGDSGQLGRDKVRSCSSFGFVLSGARQICAGKDHSLALCGPKVMGWGNSREGQLGLLITRHYHTPQQLNVYPCDLIFAGLKYSIFVTSKGIYGTGLNSDFQLGLGHSSNVQVPRKLPIDEEVIKVSGGSYCLAGTSNNEWYIWGDGVLGLYIYPTKVSFLQGAETVSLGQNGGIYVKKDRVWAWGNNGWGQLGSLPEINDYALESQEFSSMRLNGFSWGEGFLATYANGQSVSDKFSEVSSYLQSQPSQNDCVRRRRNLGDSQESLEVLKRNIFERYNIGSDDRVKELQRKNQSENQSVCENNSAYETSYETGTMHRGRQQSAKEQTVKKYVKLSNPIKTLDWSRGSYLEKQNEELKDRLNFQRCQKQKLQKEFLRRVNSSDKSKLSSKMSRIQSLGASPKQDLKKSNACKISFDPSQPESISFRPHQMDGQALQQMGVRIKSLKQLLAGLVN